MFGLVCNAVELWNYLIGCCLVNCTDLTDWFEILNSNTTPPNINLSWLLTQLLHKTNNFGSKLLLQCQGPGQDKVRVNSGHGNASSRQGQS